MRLCNRGERLSRAESGPIDSRPGETKFDPKLPLLSGDDALTHRTVMPIEPRWVYRARIESPGFGCSNFVMPPEMTTSPAFNAMARVARWLASQASAFRGFPITSAAVWVPTI